MVPLGIAGNVGWYIDPIGQVQSFAPPYGKGHLLGLFCGRANYLRWAWAAGQEGIDGYAAEAAAAALIGACAAGPTSRRSAAARAGWRAAAGRAAHRHGPADRRPAGRGRRLRLPDPARHRRALARTRRGGATRTAAAAAAALLAVGTPGEVDPVLLLGWIGAAFLGGALPWRPAVYLTGDAATGNRRCRR